MTQIAEHGAAMDLVELVLGRNFTAVEGLGAGVPAVLCCKAEAGGSYRRARYVRQREAQRAGRVFTEMRQSLPGFIRFGRLDELLAGRSAHRLDVHGIEPYDFTSRGALGLFALHDDERVRLVDLETGATLRTIPTAWDGERRLDLYNVHTLQLHPQDADRALIAVTGLDRVLELELSTGQITWEWCPWHHGLHTNAHGLTVLDKGDAPPPAPEGARVTWLDREAAQARVDAGRRPDEDEVWLHEVELTGASERLGLLKWQRVKLINSAYYADDGDKVMLTFWQTGELACVDRSTGEAATFARGLGCPHSVISVGGDHLVTDTSHGRVLRFDASLALSEVVDFTGCPLPPGADLEAPEWTQNTHALTPELLATFDFRRSRVVVWSPTARTYTSYVVDPELVIQSIQGLHPSSLGPLGFSQP